MSELFKWDQDVFLQNLFISLDTNTLRNCREVSILWREFIDRRVWSCERLKAGLLLRLWKDFLPINDEFAVRGSLTSISCDETATVVGYTDGTCEVISEGRDSFIETLGDKQEEIYFSSSQVSLGNNLLVKIAYGSDESRTVMKYHLAIWKKTSFIQVFDCVQENKKYLVHLQVVGDEIFIRTGNELSKLKCFQDHQGQIRISETYIKNECELPIGDFWTNGEYILTRGGYQDIHFYKFGVEEDIRKVSTKQNIVTLCVNDQSVALLEDFQISLLNLSTEEIQIRSQSSVRLKAMSNNSYVVAILDDKNMINLYTWKDLTNPKLPTCQATSSFHLPLPPDSYSHPLISLSSSALLAALPGSNRILSYHLWRRGTQHIGDHDLTCNVGVNKGTCQEGRESALGIRDL